MGFLPKDYVGVHTRVEQFHKKYPNGQITTDFKTVGDIISFKAEVVLDMTTKVENRRTFSGSSLGDVHKEKAFEKLETVAVGRALAFAGFEIKSGIASGEEMTRFNQNNEERRDLGEVIEDIRKEEDLDSLIKFKDEAKEIARSDKQKQRLEREYKTAYQKLVKNTNVKTGSHNAVKDGGAPF